MLSFYFYSTHVETLSCPSGCWSGLAEAPASQPNSKSSSCMPINSAMCPKDSYDLQAANNPGQEEVWVQCKCTECLKKETWEIKTEQAISQRSECLLSNAASSGAFLRSGALTHTHIQSQEHITYTWYNGSSPPQGVHRKLNQSWIWITVYFFAGVWKIEIRRKEAARGIEAERCDRVCVWLGFKEYTL